jgi:uncharacterized phage-associated protein
MKILFNEKKATQVASIFLSLSGGSLNYMKLIKLMYLAERETLLSWGRPITYDTYFSLPHGPILSSTYTLISDGNAPGAPSYWLDYISSPSNYEVRILQCCPTSELSKVEKGIIQEVFYQFGHIDKWALVNLLHETLPEWKDPAGSCSPIEIKDILAAGGVAQESIDAITEEIEESARISELIGAT